MKCIAPTTHPASKAQVPQSSPGALPSSLPGQQQHATAKFQGVAGLPNKANPKDTLYHTFIAC